MDTQFDHRPTESDLFRSAKAGNEFQDFARTEAAEEVLLRLVRAGRLDMEEITRVTDQMSRDGFVLQTGVEQAKRLGIDPEQRLKFLRGACRIEKDILGKKLRGDI